MEIFRGDPYTIRCICGEGFCLIKHSRSSKNPGRMYAECPCSEKAKCKFWCWVDEIRICECGKGPCKLLTSHTKKNYGKKFYVCPKSSYPEKNKEACGFFFWKLENTSEEEVFEKNGEKEAKMMQQPIPLPGEASSSLHQVEEDTLDEIRLKLKVEAAASMRFGSMCQDLLLQLDNIVRK